MPARAPADVKARHRLRGDLMPAWICVTCGVQYPDTDRHPDGCPICADERQYVGWNGQQWTTMAEIARDHTVVMRNEEADLVGIGLEPPFAIGQRALLVRTPHGNVMWDCISLLDQRARRQIADLGGIAAICLSHPHFYAAAVLHWPAGNQQRGALLTGDTITVVQDREWVSFMWSYPNLIPLDQATVLDIARRVERFTFDRVYGGWWGRIVVADGAGAIRRSADRYVARLNGQRPPQQAGQSR